MPRPTCGTHEDLAGEEARVPRRPRDLDRRMKPSHTVRPRTITVDKNPAYPSASKSMKKAGELSRFARLRQVRYPIILSSRTIDGSNDWFARALASSL